MTSASARTHYDVLGIDATASADEIRRAYRQLARIVHPDRHVGDAIADGDRLDRAMAELNHAWTTLADPARRRAYDATIGVASVARAEPRRASQRVAFDAWRRAIAPGAARGRVLAVLAAVVVVGVGSTLARHVSTRPVSPASHQRDHHQRPVRSTTTTALEPTTRAAHVTPSSTTNTPSVAVELPTTTTTTSRPSSAVSVTAPTLPGPCPTVPTAVAPITIPCL